MSAPVLTLRNIRVRLGDRFAVDDVSLDVCRGEITGLLGPNGSGKSTLLAVAAGLLDPAEGEVRIDGHTRAANPASFAIRIGYVPRVTALYEELTAAENLLFFGKLYGLAGKELRRRAIQSLTRLGVAECAGQRVCTMSGGLKQRVNIAAALLHEPAVLLLDEPTANLDAASRDRLFADLDRLRDDGHAVVFTTNQWDEAELTCDRVAVLERGKLAACGEPRDLRAPAAGRAVLYGHLRARPPRFAVQAIRLRIEPGVKIEVTGRRLRLSADSNEQLGRALACILAEGFAMETFRTPPAALGRHPVPMNAEAA